MVAMAASISLVLATSFGGRLVGSRGAETGRVLRRSSAGERSLRLAATVMLPLLLAPVGLLAQALPFHTETAITSGFEESAARTFASLFGRSGLFRDGERVADPMRRDIDVFVQPFAVLPFAITPMWTTRVIVPVVHKSMDFTTPGGRRSYSTTGVGDVIVDTKWIFYHKNHLGGTTRVGIEGGVKLPVGHKGATLPDGSIAPRPLQVGSGSWDFPLKALFTKTEGHFGLLSNAGYRINTTADGFKAGNVFSYDVAVGLRFRPWVYESLRDKSLVAYLELNGEVAQRSKVGGVQNPDSGGHVLFLSPDLQWIPTPWLLFEGSVQFPIAQDLNGTQLEYDTRFQFGARIRFSIFRSE